MFESLSRYIEKASVLLRLFRFITFYHLTSFAWSKELEKGTYIFFECSNSFFILFLTSICHDYAYQSKPTLHVKLINVLGLHIGSLHLLKMFFLGFLTPISYISVLDKNIATKQTEIRILIPHCNIGKNIIMTLKHPDLEFI